MLTKYITDFLMKEESVKTFETSPRFRPSSLGSPCLRKIYYSYLRIEEDFTAPLQLKKYALLGTQIHEMLASIFRKQGILIDYKNKNGSNPKNKYGEGFDFEFPIKDKDLELSAKIDAVLKIDGKIYIAEFKTATVKSFLGLKTPKPDHLIQASLYYYTFLEKLKSGEFSHIPELQGITDLAGLIILYVNKDDLSIKEFKISNINVPFTEAVKKMLKVKEHVNNGTLPEKTEDWCNSCPWRTKCLQNYKK